MASYLQCCNGCVASAVFKIMKIKTRAFEQRFNLQQKEHILE